MTLAQQISGDYADWSPNGQQLAVAQNGNAFAHIPTTLAITDLTGLTITVAFSSTATWYSFGGIAWSPTGDWIAMSFGSHRTDQLASFSHDIYLVAPSGIKTIAIADTSKDEYDPSWSPDGQWLVYIAATDSTRSAIGTITFAKIDGSCLVSGYSHAELSGLDWSPAGDMLAVTYRNQLYVVDIATMLGHAYTDLDALCPSP
jgi:Tol biopolymer transport system component